MTVTITHKVFAPRQRHGLLMRRNVAATLFRRGRGREREIERVREVIRNVTARRRLPSNCVRKLKMEVEEEEGKKGGMEGGTE